VITGLTSEARIASSLRPLLGAANAVTELAVTVAAVSARAAKADFNEFFFILV
jgi:hypothetical protein